MQITHLGHACLLVEVADQRILIDPGNFSDLEELHDLTAVVVTHQHQDHCDPARVPDLLRDNPQARVLVESQTAEVLTAAGHAGRTERMESGTAVALGVLEVLPLGELHADNHPFVPRVGNLGVRLRAADQPTLFHPGDALDAEPGEIDLLAVPVNAPWGKVAEAIAFVSRLAPRRGIVPIHDGLLNDAGRALYLNHITRYGLVGDARLHDLRDAGAVQL
ncbi:MAG: MBL fold metallo-hydrolase [Ornithinimicrobium sp.]|uniref:MBL fold metallo-hydrolase n=1 Tax=Ornithinimicrobium sp. TaxID=1977084 RepID=UPI0026E0310E|nr:MBL fold metallo-hydrolase [Ornithinimicrobium sp.]MDO5739520.1 MBL fold metallo-hydrolase [Ornithinimicrobium sp.]